MSAEPAENWDADRTLRYLTNYAASQNDYRAHAVRLIDGQRARIAGLEKERAAFLALLAPFADAHRAVEAMPYPMRYSFSRAQLSAARIAVDDAVALELAKTS